MTTTVLHLIPVADLGAIAEGQEITNASLEREGFIHCTDAPEVLLNVANAFYRNVPGDVVALHIDVDSLTSPCVWEAPADLGDTGEAFAPSFPHIYGAIDRHAVVAVQPMIRDADGAYIGYGAVELPST